MTNERLAVVENEIEHLKEGLERCEDKLDAISQKLDALSQHTTVGDLLKNRWVMAVVLFVAGNMSGFSGEHVAAAIKVLVGAG